MATLSKACKPGDLESHNSLKLSFTNIQDLRSNFVECKSFLELSYPDISGSMGDKLGWLNCFGNFSVGGYLPLIGKNYITRMHGLAACVKKGLLFIRDLSLEKLCGF